MKFIGRILAFMFIIALLFNSSYVYAKRGIRTWDDLLKSSELIASALLTKIESDFNKGKHTAYFTIDRVYKGEEVKNIEVISTSVRQEDKVYLKELGNYILFLKKKKMVTIT